MRITTDNYCVACGANRKKKLLVFTENFIPYCSSYWLCNESHPNHPKQKQHIQLYNFKEIQDLIAKRKPEDSQIIKQLMSKPFSVRISDYKTINFLIELKKIHDLNSFSDALRYCIDQTMEKNQIEIPDESKTNEEDLTF